MKRALAVSLCCVVLASCAKREAVRPNVLLITLDTFRADRVGPGTPNLERLAHEGVSFVNADSAVPLTLPSHATILSGLLPLHHGLRNNGAGSFPADHPTLATTFSAAGYRTGAFISAFVLDHRFGLNRGFDTYDDAIARDPNSNSSYDAERRGGETVDRALAWLSRPADRPFFAWVHLYDAHAPYAPPQPYPQTYDGEIAYVDAQLGRLLASIDRNKTMIVVTGDHGEALGEHSELTHGLLLYEPTLHVPFIVAGPGIDARTVRASVTLADIAPTVTSIALHQSLAGDGIALDPVREPAERNLYAETEYPSNFGWSDLASMRWGRLKLIEATHAELYDLDTDPHEQRNIFGEERRAYRTLADALAGVRATARAASTAAAVDEETRRKLASLGYVAPTASANLSGPRPDPVAMAPLFRIFEEANAASNENRHEEAIAKLRTIAARDPANPVFRGSLARAFRQSGRLREAIPLYREAVAMAPDDPEAWYNLAVALQEAGLTKEGGVAIREAVRRDPQRPEAHNALGIAYLSEGNPKAAEEEFAKVIEIDPRDARAFTNLGNVHRGAGRLDDAAREYEQSLALWPNYADALNGMGVVEVQRDRPRDAVSWFDKALEVAPDFYEAQLNRGIALQLAGDRAAAVAQLRDLLARLPPSPEFAAQRRAATELLSQLAPR
ncbi:MAG TPA: sulfatase-like hydrolase/transferase [Thermoanaerobaculia bacterium]|nr:sulfatase-like hydrolase/transferase [Thermoanaerobaculia bacterium]